MQSLLAQTANPEAPNEMDVSQPSDVLTARPAAAGHAPCRLDGGSSLPSLGLPA